MSTSQIRHTPRIVWQASRSSHPTRVASWQAIDAITRKDRTKYLSLYAKDGVIHDPVGRTATDPNGMGHLTHVALSRFWDETIEPLRPPIFPVHRSLATDDQVANSFTMIMQPPDVDEMVSLDCIFVYRVDDSGLLLYVGGYWETSL